ncbi:MAG: hypothetical protein V4631_09420 [Pseudomonadota bacterium]
MKNLLYVRGLPLAASLAVMLSACGGGGGSAGTPPPPPPPTGCGIQIVADATVAAGKTAGAAALSCGAPLNSVTWTQVSGPSVTLPASRTPTVAIETSATGVIRLRADAVLADGSAASATTDITVGAAPTGSYVTVRVDHSLRPGTDTSVRAWPLLASGETLSSITWSQTAGPTVVMNTTTSRVMMFKAPDSASDVALKFRATMTTSSGKIDTDDVIVSVDRQTAMPNGYIFERTARVHPYRAAGLYAGVLARCSYDVSLFYVNDNNQNLCPVNTLPLLQAEAGAGGVPTVAQVMGRVLVSHDFLGENFERFLTNQDVNGDFRRLLAGVTTIVLGSHVRPSFYTAGTGAIYLDAGQLWLTPEQRDVVTEVPDYRSSFDDELNFTGLGRMVKNNDYVLDGYSSTGRVNRPEGELVFQLGRLMYHELGHAGDFYPPAQRILNGGLSIWRNVVDRIVAKNLPSDMLSVQFPLTSAQMKGLGQVMYQGTTASSTQKAYTAAQVGGFFGGDVASDDYAYSINGDSASREDLAMLFEEFMMAYRHGAQYDVAYTNKYVDGMTSADLVVAWGQRGRIGHPSIKPRIKLVLAQIAPWIPASAVDALPAPIQMAPGSTWESSLVQASSPITGASPSPLRNLASATAMSRDLKQTRARQDVDSRRHAH